MGTADAIFESLKNKIERKELKEDASVPSENALAAEFNCARGTVRTALKRLEREGFAKVTADKRRLVARREEIHIVRLSREKDPTPSMGLRLRNIGRKEGWVPQDQILNGPIRCPIADMPHLLRLNPSEVKDGLKVRSDEKVWWFGRVRLANTLPLVIQWTVLPVRYVVDLGVDDLVPGGLWNRFQQYGLRRIWAHARYRPVAATAEEAIQLQVQKGAPLMEECRVNSCSRKGKTVLYEYTVTLYTDRACVYYDWGADRHSTHKN